MSEPRLVTLSGELDVSTRGSLKSVLATLGDAAEAIIDLRDVRYVDSAALADFAWLADRFRKREAEVVWIIAGGSHVERVLQISGLSQSMTIVATPEEAQQRLRR